MWEFAFYILLFVLVLVIATTHHEGLKWWVTKKGKRVAFGLFLAPTAAILIGMIGGCTTVDVYAGLERTKNLSPMCDPGGADDKLTSNIGVVGCRVVSDDGRTRLCGLYRHHSCAISQDSKSYDTTAAIKVTRRIYGD